MKRTAGIFLVLAAAGGCVNTDSPTSAINHGGPRGAGYAPAVPGVQGGWGQPVPMIAPYAANPPQGAQLAQAMMRSAVPLGMVQPGNPAGGSGIVQASASSMPGAASSVMNAGGFTPPGMSGPPVMSPPGMPAPPGGGIQRTASEVLPYVPPVPNAVAAVGAIVGPGGPRFPTQRSEVKFVGPSGMKVSWPGPYGVVQGNEITAPGRYNFIQGGIYRLKLSDLPGRPGVDLYPTLEVVPANLKTDAYIAHSAIPLYITDEDIEQVLGGNFLVKVIYLPNPQYADVAVTGGPDEIVSTRLEPGLDPIAEACKRGSIMLILRVGNIDLEAPNTPPMNAPNPYAPSPDQFGGPCITAAPPAGMPMPPGMQGMPLPPGAGVVPVKAPVGVPVSRLPDASPIKPVKYQEPAAAPTPAQLAGQRQ
ncbi:MAG: hypothetical protein JNM56_04000 [Planctomycetia bacterium]|nr:hypothetical protein [Planctomycetia bacterium]